MDYYVYYWPANGLYCYREELIRFIEKYGDDYDTYRADEFFSEVWSQ